MTSQTTLHRHPIRGFIWGLVFGLGVAGLLIVFSIVPLSIPNLIIYPVVIAVAGTLWGLFAPPKKPKGPEPTRIDVSAPPAAAPQYEEEFPESSAALPPEAPRDEPVAEDADEEGMGDEDEEETPG